MPPVIVIAGKKDRSCRDLMAILEVQGYEVRCCSLEEALAEDAAQPDLLMVMDETPEGHERVRLFKSREATREIPLIVTLDQFDAGAAARALESGADEFLVQPFRPQEVLARVAVLLRLQDDRRLLMSSQEEFNRIFHETPQPLFLCDCHGGGYTLNPTLARLLGYSPKDRKLPLSMADLLYGSEDQERLAQILARRGEVKHVKVNLRSRDGIPVTVLLNDVALPQSGAEILGFKVEPVGHPSPLKKALKGLVEHLLPSARDYLALLQLTPLMGGRYEKIRKLGQGSFGEVWLVLDTEELGPQRHYVAKIPYDRAASPKFRKEAAICQRLAPHPGVVGLVATLEEDGKLVLIQEYVAGQTLGDMLGEMLPRPLVERIVLQLIEVVAHAHRNRIIHRDIKPNNIIIQPDGVLKLLDFGAAKILKEKEIGATVVGSRPFMAPEQIMGESERRSDIWAIGVLMYLLYTGELPFYSEVEKLLIDMILEQEPVPPREENPEIPPALEDIIMKCLKKKVDERYPHALALRDDLLRQFPHYGTQTGRWPWIQ
ncbi:MAG: PAS domain-containing protein [Deltaproteobacteria bacterium]|nr:MAG: PAS domain-containing protein [Deltaproteobacteria bacterium]